MQRHRALFLDRDGIINEDVHYAHKPDQIRFRDGIFDLCRNARERGYLLLVMTNQAGIAKGHFTEDDVAVLHRWMARQFADRDVPLTAFYYCPYHKEGTVPLYRRDDDCRKPKPGMFLKAAEEHDIDLARSLMVGDKLSDRIELPGLRSVIVKSDYVTEGYDIETIADVIPLL